MICSVSHYIFFLAFKIQTLLAESILHLVVFSKIYARLQRLLCCYWSMGRGPCIPIGHNI